MGNIPSDIPSENLEETNISSIPTVLTKTEEFATRKELNDLKKIIKQLNLKNQTLDIGTGTPKHEDVMKELQDIKNMLNLKKTAKREAVQAQEK
jgi:hypothetical protein